MKQDTVSTVVSTTPAVLGSLYSWLTLDKVAAMCTIVYAVISAAYLVYKWRRELRGEVTAKIE